MRKAHILIIFFISILAAGCTHKDKSPVSEKSQTEITPIAKLSSLPENLSWIPQYPETPREVTISEYETGWQIEYKVSNPFTIAQTAWLTAWKDEGWTIEQENVFTDVENIPHAWSIMTKDDKRVTVRMRPINNIETILSTYVSK